MFSIQGIKAREILHANMEKIIAEKMERQQAEEEYHDAFDYILSSSKEHGQPLSIQELKVPERRRHGDLLFRKDSDSNDEIRLHVYKSSLQRDTRCGMII